MGVLRPSSADPDPINPWDAVNAIKVEIAATKAGGEPTEDLKIKLAAAVAAAERLTKI